ncbi:MAG: transaldolase [Clostridiales bacterium]|nr:transaldolase [Clostridiales bacterium]
MGLIKDIREQFPQTHMWCDSCAEDDLTWGIEHGIVGATTNLVIVGSVLKKELPMWEGRIRELFAQPGIGEDEVAWQLIEEMGKRGAKMLEPLFVESKGKYGRLSIQTNIKNYKKTEEMTAQAVRFSKLAPNMQVKMPASPAGIRAYEEATYQGVNINATVSFSVAQAVQVAEAVERGLARRRKEGLPTDDMTPVCTIMIGRVDDWLKKVVKRDNIAIDPECLEWAGVAVFKHAYEIFQERGYKTRLLTAAYRNHYAWSQFVGGAVSMTLTRYYLEQVETSGFAVEETMNKPVDPRLIAQLKAKLPDFDRAYEEDGMKPEEFEHYGAFITCLEGFFKGYDDLIQMIRPLQFGKPLA